MKSYVCLEYAWHTDSPPQWLPLSSWCRGLVCIASFITWKNLKSREILPSFTDDDIDLTKVIKLAAERLFNLGVDFQVITPLNRPIDSTSRGSLFEFAHNALSFKQQLMQWRNGGLLYGLQTEVLDQPIWSEILVLSFNLCEPMSHWQLLILLTSQVPHLWNTSIHL